MIVHSDVAPGRRHASAAAGAHHRVGDHADVLSAVFERRVHTVLYRRQVPGVALDYAKCLVDEPMRWDLTPFVQSTEQLDRLTLVDARGRDVFLEELAYALQTFGRLVGGDVFAAELAVLRNDACRRFHVDQHRLRWVSTFVGPGTQWLIDDDTTLALSPSALADDIGDQVRIRQVAPGEVFVMKGKGHEPRAPGRGGPLHRSPPIAARGARRLLLTLTRQ